MFDWLNVDFATEKRVVLQGSELFFTVEKFQELRSLFNKQNKIV